MRAAKRDDYFDHNWQPGLITKMVLAQYKARADKNPDPAALKPIFIAAGCPDIAATVEYLGTKKGRGLEAFGSGSIVPEGRDSNAPFSMEAALDLHELYIDSKRLGIEPLEWLGYFSRVINDVPVEARAVVNGLCRLTVGLATGTIETVPITDEDEF